MYRFLLTPYRAKVCFLAFYCFLVATLVGLTWRSGWDSYRSLGPAEPATVAQLQSETAPRNLHVLTGGLKRIGQPQITEVNGEPEIGYVRVGGGDDKQHPYELVLSKSGLKNVAQLDRFLSQDGIEGYVSSQCSQKRERKLHSEFPKLIGRPIRLLVMDANPPTKRLMAIAMVLAIALLGVVHAVALLFLERRKQRMFEDKLDDDRQLTYNEAPKAMQLIGHSSAGYLPTMPSDLTVDPFYQVPSYEPRKGPRWNRATALIIGAGLWLIGFLAYKYSSTPPSNWIVIPYFLGIWVGAVVWSANHRKNPATLSEAPMDEASAVFTRTSWHRYHDAILKELDFERVFVSRALGIETALCRSIYLSPNHGVMVEIGILMGREYFSVESLLNDGSCVQTCTSLPSTQGLQTSQPGALVRMSANKKTLVEAFEIHDAKIAEMTDDSGVMVAALTPDNCTDYVTHAHELALASVFKA